MSFGDNFNKFKSKPSYITTAVTVIIDTDTLETLPEYSHLKANYKLNLSHTS